MGKDKRGQRTKGNIKPSSSGRSAELMGGVAGFVGFGGLSDLGYVPAATQASIDDDTQISAEFRVTLRKMSKKDAITKIKALQEFEGLCSTEDIDSIKTALPYWPRLYTKLSVDCDRRVRESTQNALSALVVQIGKGLAPYLRSIMPSWLLSMTDPHTPSATTAVKSFYTAFSEEKRPGAMTFCSREIIDFFSDNLFIQSPQTMSDSDNTAKEDRENKYLRILFCSLKGFSLFLETASKLTDKKGEILAKIIPFIENEKFWKYSNHESTMVRSAWFDTVKALFEFDVETLRSYCEKLSKIIFTSLDCPDSIVLPYIWIAFLHLCVGLPECWNFCGNSKSVFNRIFAVLRDGGRGNISEIGPLLLPILSVIPLSAMDDLTSFYTDFFRAISTSFRKERVLARKRDTSSIIIALNECLKYISREQGQNEVLWKTLMTYQVLEPLRSSFVDMPQLSETVLYQETAKLIFYWTSASDSASAPGSRDKLDSFWSDFLPLCESWVFEGDKEIISKLKTFFDILKNPFSTIAKRSKGVRFSDAESVVTLNNGSQDPNTSTVTEQSKTYLRTTSIYISPLIKCCLTTYNKSKKDHIYNLFGSLLFAYAYDDVYSQMMEYKLEDPQLSRTLFLESFVLPLIDENSSAPVEMSVDIFLHVYSQLGEERKRFLLMNLKPKIKVNALKALVEKMTEKSESDGIAALWLQSAPLGGRMVKCLQQLCAISHTKGSLESHTVREQHQHLTDLLVFTFSNGYQSRTVFSVEYLSQMLKSLRAILAKIEISNDDESCAVNMVLLTTKLLNCLLESPLYLLVDGLEDVMKQIFYLLCYPFDSMSEEVKSKVQSCFLRGFELILKENMTEAQENLFNDKNSLFAYVLEETKTLLMSEACFFAKTLELSDLIEKILIILFRCSSPEDDCQLLLDHSVMHPTLEALLPTDCEWSELEEELSPLYVAPVVLFGTFICREFPLPSSCRNTPPWSQKYIRVSLFLVRIVLSLCRSPMNSAEGRNKKDVNDGTISLGQFTPLVVLAIHGACHSADLLKMNTILSTNNVSADVRLGSEKLSRNMKTLFSLINVGNKKLIVKQLKDRSLYGNVSWCVTLNHVLTSWMDVPIDALKLISGFEESLGFIETKQVLLPYFPESSLMAILMEEVEKLSSLSEDPFSALPSVCVITSVLEYFLSPDCKYEKCIASPEVEHAIHTIFNVLVKWRDKAANIFLFASDLCGVSWEDVSLMVSIIRLLTVIVKGHSLHLLHSHWDVALCALSAWVQSLVEVSKSPESNTVVAMFTIACSKIAGVVSELMSKLTSDSGLKDEYPPTLLEEWHEFYAPSIFNTLLLRFISCADAYHKEKTVILYSLTRSLALSVASFEGFCIKDVNLSPRLNISDSESSFKLPENLQYFLNYIVPLLVSRHPQCQYASYCLLKAALPEVMEAWDKNPSILSDIDDLPQRPLPHALLSIVEESGAVVDAALMDKEMGCACEVLPYTDSYTYTAGYLLAWLLMISAVIQGEESNQQLYASYIRESNVLFNLLNNLFKLMPLKPTFDKNQNTKSDATMFSTPIHVSTCGKVSSEFILWLACQVYLWCLSQFPAAVRSWWTNLDRNTQQTVDKYTLTHASPVLIANEISTINDSTVKYDNMTIKTRPGAREIIATYTIDESSMELVLRIAPNHPLSTVTLDDHKRVGVSIAQWRNWLFGLNTMLSHRNTSLLNSLEFWKKNVDQKFDGIEECFICYYVLHGTSHQIPKLLCRTCKKKFHSACLYKWFSTSHNSTCPICRTLF